MKIGIVTYHHVINDGAVLQAYAQQQALQLLFPEARVEIIDFRYKCIEKRERFDVLKDILKLRKSAYSKFRKYRTTRKFINSQLVLSSPRLVSDDLNEITEYINKNYTAVVVGSDEVWKIDYKRFSRPFPNIYWLPKPISVIRIAAAATANKLNIEGLKEPHKKAMREFLNDFRLIGVRDQFTLDLVKAYASNPDVFWMPDPTFSLRFETAIFDKVRQKLIDAGVDLSRPIIGLSLSSNISSLKALSGELFRKFDELNCQVVSIGQYNEYCHVNLTASLDPLEWAHVYRFFQFCITDRFHSTIFSIRNHIGFAAVDASGKYKSNVKGKIYDLLSRIDMLDNHVNLKDVAMEDVFSKMMKLFEDSRRGNLEAKLEAIDKGLTEQYQAFLAKIKTILTKT